MKKSITKANKILKVVMSIIAVIASIGIGGLFINGTFMNVFLLKYLPLLVHQIVGYTLAVGTLVGVVLSWIKK